MGMLGADQEQSRNLAEVFPPGTPFRLVAAFNRGLVNTGLGERLLFTIHVSEVEVPEQVYEYGVWGTLAEQLTQLEAGELPAIVNLIETDGVWQFAPHGPPPINAKQPDGTVVEVPQRVAVEAHMVPDAPADSPLGAVQERQPPTPPPVPEGGHRPPVPVEPPSVKPTPIDEAQTFQPGTGTPG